MQSNGESKLLGLLLSLPAYCYFYLYLIIVCFYFLARSHSVFCKMVALLVAVILGAYKVNGDKLGSSN